MTGVLDHELDVPLGPGRLILLVGPSGAGKDTLLDLARAAFPDDPTIVFPRRTITRPAGPGEDFDTQSVEAFDAAAASGAFALRWQAHELRYGIPRHIDDDIRAGRTVICNVSRGITGEARQRYAHAAVVLATAPDEVLAARIAGRGRETGAAVASRVARATAMQTEAPDLVIHNTGTPESAAAELIAFIKRGRVSAGVVKAVSLSPVHEFSKPNEARIHLLKGLGVEGDTHLGTTVQHRSRVAKDPTQPNLRQVHLIHEELFDEMRAAGYELAPGQIGENVTTSGIDLLALPTSTRLHIGADAVVEVTGLRNPCKQLNDFQPGLMQALIGRDADGHLIRKAGVMGVVLTGGDVRPGDAIRVELPAQPHEALKPV